MTTETNQLSKEEVLHYFEKGYVGPYTLCSPSEMYKIAEIIINHVLKTDPPREYFKTRAMLRHLDQRIVYNLCTHPTIMDRIKCIFGDNIMLWASQFFNKEPGSKAVPWHQDINYWPIEPAVNVSAWIAIDASKVENSCVQVIPGSHRKIVPHIKTEPGSVDERFTGEADPRFMDINKAIAMELEPGQFFLFSEKLLHYSAPNNSNKRRLGLSARFTVPFVKNFSDYPSILVSGNDQTGINTFINPPEK